MPFYPNTGRRSSGDRVNVFKGAFKKSKFYARQGAIKIYERSICMICKRLNFLSNVVSRRSLGF
jgi:hypothetical protein